METILPDVFQNTNFVIRADIFHIIFNSPQKTNKKSICVLHVKKHDLSLVCWAYFFLFMHKTA